MSRKVREQIPIYFSIKDKREMLMYQWIKSKHGYNYVMKDLIESAMLKEYGCYSFEEILERKDNNLNLCSSQKEKIEEIKERKETTFKCNPEDVVDFLDV